MRREIFHENDIPGGIFLLEDFKVKPMFEDQHHERHQFKVTVEGKNFLGIMHKGEIKWFNPDPHRHFEKDFVHKIEARVHELFDDGKRSG
ncbi:YheE family protein [Bacillus sp. B-jedd]|uniref:YheE family protein n=1 Tax=Bacillus sp. B-jedd TaxID=1476857 RepID=UPI0005155682|nr:YheE family protein [Bacillus sp. B-jedd]CEG25533.1 hypothetical protein BN1002_00345 [Bacillus sp. B-jedd]